MAIASLIIPAIVTDASTMNTGVSSKSAHSLHDTGLLKCEFSIVPCHCLCYYRLCPSCILHSQEAQDSSIIQCLIKEQVCAHICPIPP